MVEIFPPLCMFTHIIISTIVFFLESIKLILNKVRLGIHQLMEWITGLEAVTRTREINTFITYGLLYVISMANVHTHVHTVHSYVRYYTTITQSHTVHAIQYSMIWSSDHCTHCLGHQILCLKEFWKKMYHSK